MKQKRGSGLRTFFLLLLLAVFCVLAVELAVCRVADPALYESITAPVREAGAAAGTRLYGWGVAFAEGVDAGVDRIQTLRAERKARKEREAAEAAAAAAAKAAAEAAALEAAQLASTPAVEVKYVPADPTITELVERDGVEILTGGNVDLPYFNQGEEPWASALFGVDPIGKFGCGPTALAMAVSGFSGELVTPDVMAAWAAEQGYAALHSGAYYTIAEGTAAAFGLNCVSLADIDGGELLRTLAMSDGVIFALMGPGHFTKGGHFILLHGATLTGEILVADPNSRERSLTTWDPELIVEELSPVRVDGAPLWLLTPARDRLEAGEVLPEVAG